jgi:hypothetical protein
MGVSVTRSLSHFRSKRASSTRSPSCIDSVPGHVAAAHRFGVAVPFLFLRPSKVRQGTRFELRLLLPSDESGLIDAITLTPVDDKDVQPGHFWPRKMERWLLDYGVPLRIPDAERHIDRRMAAERVNAALARASILDLVALPQ